jgi:Carboxypeptidase regulatory-like domain
MKPALVLIISCLPLVIGSAEQKKGTGVIYGTVVSQNGQPGKRISLYAEPLDVGGQFPNTRSNDRGEYRFENLPWGRYTVSAEDDDAGYSGDVIDDSSQPSVEISRERPNAEFRVVLPSKAGLLQIHLTNRRTGAAIPWMGVTVAPMEEPRRSRDHTCKSSELILVPPDRNLILHITAGGFREWDESAGTGKLIFVPSGTRLTLTVQLDPVQ